MVADRHGEKLDFDVPVTVVRGDDLGRYFQAMRADPGRFWFANVRGDGGDDGRCRLGERFAPAAPGRRLGPSKRRRETPAAHVPHVTDGVAARALARGHVLQADRLNVGGQPDGVEWRWRLTFRRHQRRLRR